MNIIQVNTCDIQGGAARAAYRLHRGLIQIGQQSLMLVKDKFSSDASVYPIHLKNSDGDVNIVSLATIQDYYINSGRTAISNTIFSLPYPGVDLSHLHVVNRADIINLHWVANFQSPVTLKHLLSLGKPVVWTLHDMWAFTGGCHYSAGCHKYQQDCKGCPQLTDDSYNLPAALVEDKVELFADTNLTIVTPSQWLADCARRSKLFKHHRVEVIPYSLETNVFKPLSKAEAKKAIGLTPDTITILFGADTAKERRKGFSELLSAMGLCCEAIKSQKQQLKNIVLLCFGYASDDITSLEVPVISLGYVNCNEKLREVYSAADFFILPSLEDNFPNTMLESMSCGTPVIAFETGGIPDLIKDGVTGRLVPLGDICKLAKVILECILDPNHCKQMGHNCRKVIEEGYSLNIQAEHYLELYQDLLHLQLSSIQSKSTQTLYFNLLDKASRSDSTNKALPSHLDPSVGLYSSVIFKQLSSQALTAAFLEEKLRCQYTQSHLQQTQSHLQQTQSHLQQIQSQLQQTQSQLQQTQSQLQYAQTQIEAMKTSKFWKIRTGWFQIKRKLGLPINE